MVSTLVSVYFCSPILNIEVKQTAQRTTLRCGFFSKKKKKSKGKKHLCRHDENYYYFCKSNIPVTNLIAGSRNMIKLLKNMSL